MSDVLANIRQVHVYLQEQGYKVSYGKIKADVDRGALKPRRGGGFVPGTVLAYAKSNVARRDIDASPDADRPHGASADGYGAAERRTSADAELKEIGAMRARMAFAREMGRYTETATINDELAARAKAFRLGLEKFGIDAAEQVASTFGADGKVAAELVRRLGIEGDEAQDKAVAVIVDFALSRCPIFTRRWQAQIERLLDPYSTEAWWTDEMREAWARYEDHADVEVPHV